MTNFEYKKQIQRCISQLDETYLDVFKKVEHLLRVDISSKKKRLKILLYFSEFLATHMLNNHSLDTMFPNGIDKFYSDLITNTNLNGVEKQKKIVYGIVTLGMVVSILLFSVFLYASKHIDLLKKGIAVFFENPTKYKCEITEIDQDVIFSLNLIDLSSNIGKTIYDDGECTIDIEYVQYDGNVYNITFRTHGQYNMRRGVLVTALPHIRNSNGTYTQDIHSKLYIRNREEWLPCRVTGIYGIVFKDGDKFVYTFQSTAESEVTLKISKLLKHEWYE